MKTTEKSIGSIILNIYEKQSNRRDWKNKLKAQEHYKLKALAIT